MLPLIEEKRRTINLLYTQHRESVYALQTFLSDDVLPRVADELHLTDEEVDIAREWINDCGSIFRLLKKQKFNFDVAKEATTKALRWRIAELPSLYLESNCPTPSPSSSFIYPLPIQAHDILDHPLVVVKPGSLKDGSEQAKQAIIRVHEEMRRRLHFEEKEDGDDPTLQFVILVDCKTLSMRNMAVDLIPWFMKEVAPLYPGMCAAVLVLNYSWGYGMYKIFKRLLPASVLARILFPSPSELVQCFDKECLPREYGGDLDVSLSYETLSDDDTVSPPPNEEMETEPPPRSSSNLSHLLLPAMSTFNPYFGYPVVSSPGSSVPHLKNGRRRKRDLARTLFRLWLKKLRKWTDNAWLWVIMSIVLWVVGMKELRK